MANKHFSSFLGTIGDNSKNTEELRKRKMVKYRRMTIEQACEDTRKRTEHLNLHPNSWRRSFTYVELEGRIGYHDPTASQPSFRFVEKGRHEEQVLFTFIYLNNERVSTIKLLEEAVVKDFPLSFKGTLHAPLFGRDNHFWVDWVAIPGALSLYKGGLEGALSMSYDEGALSLSNPEK